jgi:hypothetical protein
LDISALATRRTKATSRNSNARDGKAAGRPKVASYDVDADSTTDCSP